LGWGYCRYALQVDFAADGTAEVMLELDAAAAHAAAVKPELLVLFRVLMGGPLRNGPIAQWSISGPTQVQELLQELTIQLGRVADLVAEVERLTTDIPGLARMQARTHNTHTHTHAARTLPALLPPPLIQKWF
jgi:hypothetical protein